jgi:hypothetical protein
VAPRKKSSLASLTNVVGGMLVGFDEQVLRSTPRAEILVKRGKTVRGLSAQGGTLSVGLPDDPVELDGTASGEDDDAPRTRDLVSDSGSDGGPGR